MRYTLKIAMKDGTSREVTVSAGNQRDALFKAWDIVSWQYYGSATYIEPLRIETCEQVRADVSNYLPR